MSTIGSLGDEHVYGTEDTEQPRFLPWEFDTQDV